MQATFLSLAGGELRDQVRSALAEAERDHVVRVAAAWEHMTALLGYRLRPQAGVTLEGLAMLLTGTLRGLVDLAVTMPEVGSYRASALPPGGTVVGEWSLPALGLASIAVAFVEPSPDIVWDERRIGQVLDALKSPALAAAGQAGAGSFAGRRAKPS